MIYSTIDTDTKKDILLGEVDGKKIYLSRPAFYNGWYWSFGYLGNKNCRYHLDGIAQKENLYDAILRHFDKNTLALEGKKLWIFCELAMTAYALKSTAEVLGRGGSHYTTNPVKDIIINSDEVERINSTVLPAIFSAIDDLFPSYPL